jgi:hypothetical protein
VSTEVKLSATEISDLKSLIDRAKECAVNFRNAELSKMQAEGQLESWIFAHTAPREKP